MRLGSSSRLSSPDPYLMPFIIVVAAGIAGTVTFTALARLAGAFRRHARAEMIEELAASLSPSECEELSRTLGRRLGRV